jgi:hypothetical protein
MKINGKKVSEANELVVVIPRHNQDDLIFRFRAVLDVDAFHKLVKMPEAPIVYRGAEPERDMEHPAYVSAVQDYVMKHTNYVFLVSLMSGSPHIEFETVNIEDPATWDNFRTEMRQAGLTTAEINTLVRAAREVNGVDPEKIKDATKSFLLGTGRAESLIPSHNSAPLNTESGEPAKDSASDPQV